MEYHHSKQHYSEFFADDPGDGEEHYCEGDADGDGEPEAEALMQEREQDEHGQCRKDIPECVVCMVFKLCRGLILEVEPEKDKKRHKRKRTDERTEPVRPFCNFRDNDDNSRRHKIFNYRVDHL